MRGPGRAGSAHAVPVGLATFGGSAPSKPEY